MGVPKSILHCTYKENIGKLQEVDFCTINLPNSNEILQVRNTENQLDRPKAQDISKEKDIEKHQDTQKQHDSQMQQEINKLQPEDTNNVQSGQEFLSEKNPKQVHISSDSIPVPDLINPCHIIPRLPPEDQEILNIEDVLPPWESDLSNSSSSTELHSESFLTDHQIAKDISRPIKKTVKGKVKKGRIKFPIHLINQDLIHNRTIDTIQVENQVQMMDLDNIKTEIPLVYQADSLPHICQSVDNLSSNDFLSAHSTISSDSSLSGSVPVSHPLKTTETLYLKTPGNKLSKKIGKSKLKKSKDNMCSVS